MQNINNWRLWIWKTNALTNLIKEDNDDYSISDKVYLYDKDANESKYQYLIKRCLKNGLQNLKDPKRLLLSIQIMCRMSIKILKSTTQAKNVMY